MVNIEIYDGPATALWEIVQAWKDEVDKGFGLVLDVEHFMGHLGAWIDGPDSDLLVWRQPSGFIMGFMGIQVFASPLSGEIVIEEHMWYTLPQYRSMASARAFIDAAEAWGRERGARQFLLTSSLLANIQADRVMRMYGRLGFKPFETVFIRPIGGS